MIEKQINENLTIKKVTVEEIPDFIDSKLYNSLNVKPISEPRAKSYFHNPRALASDPVIYMLVKNNQLIGFRTILPDLVKTENNEIKFGWCSGNWIDPENRRKGYSKVILDEAYEDWQHKLMYTNFARESHLLYNKTSYFKTLLDRTRTRFYADIDVRTLLKNRKYYKWIKPVTPIINFILKISFLVKKALFRPYQLKDFSIKMSNQLPADFFAKGNRPAGLFARSVQEFRWAEKHPWLIDNEKFKSVNYPFSLYEPAHKIWYLTIQKNKQITGRLILSSRDNHLKLLYNYAKNNPHLAAKSIINLCYTNRMKTFSLMDSEISRQISKLRKPFIVSKKYKMGIYSTFDISNIDDHYIHDGDGDYMFT